jgi:ParB/RepB/Spo0J family partition protein
LGGHAERPTQRLGLEHLPRDELGNLCHGVVVGRRAVLIPLDRLRPHPDNPRLSPRQDVIDQIAAQIRAHGGFDPAHALLVRRQGKGFQIVAGHHRAAAAQAAGLDAVPCWVREMDDDAAFMTLVLANSQSELSPLERGIHAIKSGLDTKAYAEAVHEDRLKVQRRVMAARVAAVFNSEHAALAERWFQLVEIHAAASWLWPALVARLIADGWNVDTACSHAGRLKDVPEPPRSRPKPEWRLSG